MRTTHKIKIREDFADAVLSGDKCFEVREDDRNYQRGDLVQFSVISEPPYNIYLSHPLNEVTYEITYVLHGWGLKEGYVAFGIARYKESEDIQC